MNKKILTLTLTFLVVALLVAPVMAMGPYQAYEVGNNKNLGKGVGGELFLRVGNAGGAIYTFVNTCGFWEKWKWFDANSGAGKSNGIIEATIPTLNQYITDKIAFCTGEEIMNENKWIYMSPEGSGYQFNHPYDNPDMGSHGMIWWFFYYATGDDTLAGVLASRYTSGAYWMYNFVK